MLSQGNAKPLGIQDDTDVASTDMLTRQLEAYLNLSGGVDSASGASPTAAAAKLPMVNPMLTATVIRARMALAAAVPKMLAAAKQAKLAGLASGAPSNTQVLEVSCSSVSAPGRRLGDVRRCS